MRQKGISIILVLWVVFFVYIGLSMGGWEAIRQAFDQTYSEQGQKDKIVSTEDEVDDVDPNVDVIHDPVDPDLSSQVMETQHKNTDISFDSQSIQNTIEKLKVEKTTEAPPPLVVEEEQNSFSSEGALSDSDIILYTNIERNKERLADLERSNLLDQAARAKLKHMFDEQYFAHVAPTGEDFSYWVEKAAYEYVTVSENLASGNFKSSEAMVTAWMNSPGHRANILREKFEQIGVAVGYGEFEDEEVWIGVQMFATSLSSCPTVDEIVKVQIDMYETLAKETEAALNSLQPILDEMQPKTQEEYEQYLSLLEQYNKLVVEHNGIIETLQSISDTYNDQVRAFNACIDSK